MAPEPSPEQSYCADQVRRHDWDRFICTLFAPADRRPALFALLAFNLEIARTRAVVSERLLGEIRLQWWRDAIAALYTGDVAVLRHPVVDELKAAIERHALHRGTFDAMIDARSDEFDRDPAASLEGLTEHARASEGNLLRLQMNVLATDEARTALALRVADDVAVAWSIALIARGDQAAAGLLDHARQRLAAARAAASQIDRRLLPALLPARIARIYLERRHPSRVRRQLGVAHGAWLGRL
jgi:NADH dehydrogenase [ubiquinone] 1 alpha subcomplex assembly factor 6